MLNKYTGKSIARVAMIDPYQPPKSHISSESTGQMVGTPYSVFSIAIATFVGGILAGSFLLLNNLELIAKKRIALLIIGVATVITIFTIFLGLFSSLGMVLTNIIVNFIESIVVLSWCTFQFKEEFDKMEGSEANQYSLGRAVLIGALTTVAVYLMLLMAYFMFSQLGGSI